MIKTVMEKNGEVKKGGGLKGEKERERDPRLSHGMDNKRSLKLDVIHTHVRILSLTHTER